MKTIIVLAFIAIAIQSCSTSKNVRKSESKKNVVIFHLTESDTAYVNFFNKEVKYSKN